MRIAIFDEGVNEVSSVKIKGGYNFRDNNINCIQKNDHGTSIAYIINKINPEVELYSIVLPLKKDSKLDEEIVEAMCKAIDWCIDNKIKIINMSLGFNEINKKVDSYLKKAYDNGIIIVCAAGNNRQNNVGSFPACSLYTISVANYDPNKKTLADTSSTGNYIDFASVGTLESIDSNGNKVNISGTSYAAPYMVGLISKISGIEFLNTEQVVATLKLNDNRDTKYGYGLILETPNKVVKNVNNYSDKAEFKYNTYTIKYGESIKYEVTGNLKYNIYSIDDNICSVGLGDQFNSKTVGETYMVLEDIYGRKSFTHIIVSPTEATKAYNVEKAKETNTPAFNFETLGINKLHAKGIKGKGIKIGIINCGVKNFMDLNITKVPVIYNGGSYNTEPYVTWESLICSKALGIAPEAEIYSIKCGDASISWASAKKGIEWCINNKMDIVFFNFIKDGDSVALLDKLSKNGIIAVGPYMYAYNDKRQYWSSNENYLNVGYVDPSNKIVTDNTKKTPIESNYIDCLCYGYGVKGYNCNGEAFTIPKTWYQVHNYRSIVASFQVIGIIALMKQQYPGINTAAKFRKLLPYLCKDLGYAKNKQGYGLIVAKLKEELPNLKLD